MYKIPTILTTDEILDKIFHRASKKSEDGHIKNRVLRKKRNIQAKLNVVFDTLDSTLAKYITAFPSFDQIHRFEFEIIDIILSVDKIRKSLGALDWARKQVRKLKDEISRKISQVQSQKDYPKLEELRSKFYGRVTSILEQISSNLVFLNKARDRMKKMPTIDPELTTLVVAGYPNVGKSLLVKQISSAKPNVATYPFTTKQLNIGHITIDHLKIQIIDTPGLLDRSLNERNKIELQAIMALKYLANIIVFIIDPTEHCGYEKEKQLSLLEELNRSFKDIQIIEIENKMDILESPTDRLKISAKTGHGLDELLNIIQSSC